MKIKFLTKTNMIKKSISILAAFVLSFGWLLVIPARAACAQSPSPALALITQVSDTASPGWTHNLSTSPGRTIQFDVQIHNTVTGSQALNVFPMVGIPSGSSTSISISSSVRADNASVVGDSDTVNIGSGGSISYVPGSTRLTWDENGDGTLDYNQTPLPDGIANGGIRIGDQSGCNAFIMHINFLATVNGSYVPPTTTYSPPTVTYIPTSPQTIVVPAPIQGSTVQYVPTGSTTTTTSPTTTTNTTTTTTTNTTSTNNNYTSNTTTAAAPQPVVTTVAAAPVSVPTKTPATGVDLASLAGMFGAGPIGFALTRYGHGLKAFGKREEDWMGIAKEAFLSRKIKKI